jgi:arsenate reductase (thioredoxin)
MYNVLILCTGNSARSIMAEAILNKEGAGEFRAFSAGSNPKGDIHPQARALLEHLGYDLSGMRSKSWSEYARPDSPEMDFIFTVCDDAHGEVCPTWPGTPMTAHWGIEDPSKATGNDAEIAVAFEEAYNHLFHRITAFIALPHKSLDQISLHAHLKAIGAKTKGATGKAKSVNSKAAAE